MIRISDAADVIQTARDEAGKLADRIKIAERIHEDFTGRRERGGLSVHVHGQYVLVDDEADRWLAERDTYESAVTTVLQAVIDGTVTDEGSDAYDLLCGECPAMYSRIGSGTHNNDEAGLLALLGETLGEDDVEEVARYLGIEIPEPADAE